MGAARAWLASAALAFLVALASLGVREARAQDQSRPQAEAQERTSRIGNGHVVHLNVDATWNGRAWLWEGYAAADDPQLEVLAGPRRVEATIAGAGSLVLNPSQMPRRLIEACLGGSPSEPSAPA